MRIVYFMLLLTVFACETSNEAKKQLSTAEHGQLLEKLAPYVIKKSDDFTYETRFEVVNKPFYQNFIELSKAELSYYKSTDTATFFSFNYRDLTSLKEDYRVLGGYYRQDSNDSIVFVNLLYHTPRFTAEELKIKDKILFESMVTKGNVDRFLGKKDFIETPNEDFYYNTKLNRWDYTENSSWKFLDNARQEAPNDSIR